MVATLLLFTGLFLGFLICRSRVLCGKLESGEVGITHRESAVIVIRSNEFNGTVGWMLV